VTITIHIFNCAFTAAQIRLEMDICVELHTEKSWGEERKI